MLSGALPKYLQVAEEIRGQIQRGTLVSGGPLAAERDIAESLQVSRICVRKAIEHLVEDGVLVRSHGRRAYVRVEEPAADVPVAVRNVIVLTSVPFERVVDSRYSDLGYTVTAAVRGLESNGLYFTYINNWNVNTPEKWRRLLQDLRGLQAAGCIYFPASGNAERQVLDLARRQSMPLVLLHAPVPAGDATTHAVDLDDAHGTFLATQHLLQQGYRRVAFASFVDDLSWIAARLRGYRKAMEESGFSADVIACGGACGAPDDAHLAELARRLSAPASQRPEALVAVSDPLALAVHAWAGRQGLRIPQDLALVGFDDLPAAAERGLTTVSRMAGPVGERAVEILLSAVRKPGSGEVVRDVIQPNLIVRQSSRRETGG